MTSPEALRRVPTLLAPGRLGSLTLKNKMVLPPMVRNGCCVGLTLYSIRSKWVGNTKTSKHTSLTR